MTNFVVAHDFVEDNGLTVKQNNMNKSHTIPIGALVEVVLPRSEHDGVRMFVCEHTRDCDGSPLYALYGSNEFETLEFIKSDNYSLYRYMIEDGFSDSCLTVIRLPQ